jgi:Zn-finger nucleic acid-binding protein
MTIEKPSKNEEEYFALRDAELLRRQREAAEAAALEAERRSHYMKCPKDGYDLTSSAFHGVQVETCPHCGGMWVDADEIAAIAHEERPALLTRVLSDAFASLRGSTRRRDAGRLAHDPAHPLG